MTERGQSISRRHLLEGALVAGGTTIAGYGLKTAHDISRALEANSKTLQPNSTSQQLHASVARELQLLNKINPAIETTMADVGVLSVGTGLGVQEAASVLIAGRQRQQQIQESLHTAGVDYIPRHASHLTVIELDEGRFELGWRAKDANGRIVTTQRYLANSRTPEVEALIKAGIPVQQVEGRIIL